MTTTHIRKRIALFVLLLFLAACKDQDLRTVSRALNDTAHAQGELQNILIEAQRLNLISVDGARPYMELAVKINTAGKEAVAVTGKINALGAADRSNILSILQPIIAQVASTKALPLDDTVTGRNIRATLLLIEASLNTAQIALAAR